ncbi:hypothetical protein OG978_25250 [Streptomyces sp. NBC_01591]|uniref:hypothetical protein n=1 Tax=Streptomyces sp. NBC_01591 TaxID=2975888 RepID=UPI002DD9E24C|nr:hypothetical protein [Streptomyces sp. NBC_01591]WSD70392.1 hypothetical protein OG978_25250 [Streptomyces sp. NBC_01591]
MAGWVVLAAGGWGLTQWMGEPSATGGPESGPARPSGPGGEPGPQPESACDDLVSAASPRPTATAAPLLAASAAPVGDGTARLTQTVCVRARAAEPAD